MKLLQDENLEWKELWQFSCNVLMSPSHPLASRDKLTYLDFTDYIEIVQGDIQNPSFTFEAQDASAPAATPRKPFPSMTGEASLSCCASCPVPICGPRLCLTAVSPPQV